MKTATVKKYLLDQWFLVGVMIVILIASQVQVPVSQEQRTETVVSYLCITLIFFVTGCTLPTSALVQNYSRWQVHLYVQGLSFLLTSALTFAIVLLCAMDRHFMDDALLIGLLVTGCVPTTISSNVVMTRSAAGNEVLTVVESTVGNLLGPFITPLLIQMYVAGGGWYTDFLQAAHLDDYTDIYRRIFKQIGLSVFLPLAVGQVVQYFCPRIRPLFQAWHVNKVGSLCLIVVVWEAYDQAFGSGAFSGIRPDNMVFVVFISIANFLLWLTISVALSSLWLSREDTVSVAYCVPAKSPAMGIPLANLIFRELSATQQARIQVPIVIFQGLQIAIGNMLVPLFRHWVHTKQRESSGGEGGLPERSNENSPEDSNKGSS
ncbi:hypothetical protein ASPZODRAFT_20175 [Penicilliopsis zonata CBS 506.65]|uniref:Sodium bile acid symporter family protein n=1 Tax=Penicilliopsis zonata CBS 506.65 TaxID=1073090 RepID=A0A1L9S662_9EURO|nr:hypothetical protein ASPZODRAFT_20175 [Penicilliopsis zonata CBS 506.65]OJJ42648.1 hypothetical protein ASPZODRAFT_20175 [Penicilliopsis zonata CBS 506.65]